MPDRLESRRYYTPAPLTAAAEVALDESEAHHLAHVLRARADDWVTLFNGQGQEAVAQVSRIHRSQVVVRVGEVQQIDRELPCVLTLGVALPKGDRQRWLIEKMVELGVASLTPLVTERSDRGGLRGVDKLSRYVIEASKQCGRNRLMAIQQPEEWSAWGRAATVEDELRWVADPGGEPLADVPLATGSAFRLAIGPEGGWTAAEIEMARDGGWQIIGLGPRILRIETAALALTSCIANGRRG